MRGFFFCQLFNSWHLHQAGFEAHLKTTDAGFTRIAKGNNPNLLKNSKMARSETDIIEITLIEISNLPNMSFDSYSYDFLYLLGVPMCPEAEGEAAGEATEGKRLSLDEILLVRGDLPRLPPPLLTGIQRRLWPLAIRTFETFSGNQGYLICQKVMNGFLGKFP